MLRMIRYGGAGNVSNRYPIILVYGFMGFDAKSFVRLPYWGGAVDLEKRLWQLGYTVYTARIGPVSSNWDRACELYAAIRGGRVDYGAAHSAGQGHARYGRSYEGLYPEWGEADPATGEPKKVHLVGHSMGGQTSRLLVSLLEEGDAAELECGKEGSRRTGRSCGSDRPPSELFEGGRSWIASVTSLNTPHDGTTLTSQHRNVGFIRRLFAKWLAVSNARREDPMIDLQLDHWETAKADGETFLEFLRRAVDEELWMEIEDLSFHDLSPAGSRRINLRAPASPRVYYFSLATSATVPDPETGYHVPAKGMNLPLYANARFIGSLEELPEAAEGEPSQWWENDGIVNTRSMDGPKIGSEDRIEDFDGVPKRGVWNYMGKLFPYDHWQIHVVPPLIRTPPPGYESLLDFYRSLCELLWRT